MKTKTVPLALPFALLLPLALAGCLSSDDGPGESSPSGGAAEPPLEPTTSCEYRHWTFVRCGTSSGTGTEEIHCVEGQCPAEDLISNYDGLCTYMERIEILRTFEGTCGDDEPGPSGASAACAER
ncbi:MAG TPA: hypothetical protein VFS43_16120 [Polyangiaceae bacterium]|nr:hypothetical protein [Polyangiaceae bacterium]